MKSALERFNEKYTVHEETGCWEWTAGKVPNGYGMFWMDGRHHGAHRVSWLLHKGFIPVGLQLDHLCRVRHCVNPDHLEPVTTQENLLRGETNAAHNAAKTHCPQGHPYAGSNLYRSKTNERYCLTCIRQRKREAQNA